MQIIEPDNESRKQMWQNISEWVFCFTLSDKTTGEGKTQGFALFAELFINVS